jgi:MoxR-like ATPase
MTMTDFDFDKWKTDFGTILGTHGNFAVATPSVASAAPTTPAPAAAPTPSILRPTTGRFFRPNGDEYHARKVTIGGLKTTDVAFIQQAYDKRLPVLLSGAPGCGKTALVEAALDDVRTVQGSLDTEVSDFVGSWVQNPDGTYAWEDGPLLIQAERGKPLLVDEIALIDPRTLACVYGAMDGRDEITVTANPLRGTVKIADGFVVYGAYNPDVPGAVVSDALLSRFTLKAEVTTDWKIAEKLGVCTEAIKVAQNLNIKLANHEVTAAPQLRELLAFRDVEAIYGLDAAIANLLSFAHAEDLAAFQEAAQAIWAKMPKPLTF